MSGLREDLEVYQPAKRLVTWDARNIELRLLSAIDELLEAARGEGLTAEGHQRVVEYLTSAAYDQADKSAA